MSFVNIPFIFYFLPIVIILFFLMSPFKFKLRAQNIVLLAASLLFYFALEPRFLPFMLLSIVSDFWLGKRVKLALWEGRSPKKYLVAAYVINGAMFVVFQILATYLHSGGGLFGLEYSIFSDFIFPVGLGVFTLRSIGYVADIYNGYCEAEENFLNLALYISFFPQIVVGPIADYDSFGKQIKERSFDRDLLFQGVCRFVIGLGKKILIAGNLAVVSDAVFQLSSTSDSVTQVPVLLAWLGLLCFTLQIYYDFSSYVDMAIGLGNIFGFRTEEDYKYPYMARSMTEFWSGWNISVRTWFTRHVSNPLDNRRGQNRDQQVLNLFFSFIMLGFWYRLNTGVLIWAFLQVAFMTIEKVISYDKRRVPRVFSHIYVILVLMLSWALFRPDSLYQMLLFLRNLFGINQNGVLSASALYLLKEYWVFLLAGLLFIFPIAPKLRDRVEAGGKGLKAAAAIIYPVLLFAMVVLSMLYLARGLYVPFRYFSF